MVNVPAKPKLVLHTKQSTSVKSRLGFIVKWDLNLTSAGKITLNQENKNTGDTTQRWRCNTYLNFEGRGKPNTNNIYYNISRI